MHGESSQGELGRGEEVKQGGGGIVGGDGGVVGGGVGRVANHISRELHPSGKQRKNAYLHTCILAYLNICAYLHTCILAY